MTYDIFAIRSMVADVERAMETASTAAIATAREAETALHNVQAAKRDIEKSIKDMSNVIQLGLDVMTVVQRLYASQKVHPDIESARLGINQAQAELEEALSNMMYFKLKLEEAETIGRGAAVPVGVKAPATYKGAAQWLARWVSRF